MGKLGPITKGTWSVVDGPQYGPYNALKRVDSTAGRFGTVICERFIAQTTVANEADKEYLANFDLIVDAGNTANRTGKLPSELEAERDELLEALQAMCETMEQQNWGIKSPDQWQTEAYKQAKAVIAKPTGK